MREQMWAFRVPSPDVQDVLGDRAITDALYRIRQFNDHTTPSSSGTEVLRSLKRDAELDRGWFQRYFNPTREEALERAARMAQPNFVERLVMEHPWIALGPAGLMFKPVHTAGAMALQRVAPILLAATEVGNSIYENLINYAKGGKDAVGKSGSAGRGRTAPRKERVIRKFGSGEHWDKLITDQASASRAGIKPKAVDKILGRIERAKRRIGGDIRADARGNLYKFDPAHKSSKIHLERIEEESGKFWGTGEVNPETGEIMKNFARNRWREY
jgi:hypothetical protein